MGPLAYHDKAAGSVGRSSAITTGDEATGSQQFCGPKMDFPHGSVGEESTCNAGDLGSIPGRENPLEEEMATHSSILAGIVPWTEELGGGAWWAAVHGASKSQTQLSN